MRPRPVLETVLARPSLDPTAAGLAPAVEVPAHEPLHPDRERGRAAGRSCRGRRRCWQRRPTAVPRRPAAPSPLESAAPSIAPTASSLTTNLTQRSRRRCTATPSARIRRWTVAGHLARRRPTRHRATRVRTITIPGTDTTVTCRLGPPGKTAHDWRHRTRGRQQVPTRRLRRWRSVHVAGRPGRRPPGQLDGAVQLRRGAGQRRRLGLCVQLGQLHLLRRTAFPAVGLQAAAHDGDDPRRGDQRASAHTFTSPLYGYSIDMAGDWTAKAATKLADDPASTDGERDRRDHGHRHRHDDRRPRMDARRSDLRPVGRRVPRGHRGQRAEGCDGGDPSSWPAVTVGDRQGHWLQMCNAALAIVPADGKVYVFSWESSTFDSGSHLDPLDFKRVLLTVKLPGAAPSPSP